jgi:hypothetical protein
VTKCIPWSNMADHDWSSFDVKTANGYFASIVLCCFY